MRMITGPDAPTAGSVTINGRAYRDLAVPLTEVGALLDAKALHGGRTTANHLRVLAASNGLPDSRVNEVLRIVGLRDVAARRACGFWARTFMRDLAAEGRTVFVSSHLMSEMALTAQKGVLGGGIHGNDPRQCRIRGREGPPMSAITGLRPTSPGRLTPPLATFSHVLSSERIKLTTTRSTWITLLVALVIGIGVGVR